MAREAIFLAIRHTTLPVGIAIILFQREQVNMIAITADAGDGIER
jgi:hypothetical protein